MTGQYPSHTFSWNYNSLKKGLEADVDAMKRMLVARCMQQGIVRKRQSTPGIVVDMGDLPTKPKHG